MSLRGAAVGLAAGSLLLVSACSVSPGSVHATAGGSSAGAQTFAGLHGSRLAADLVAHPLAANPYWRAQGLGGTDGDPSPFYGSGIGGPDVSKGVPGTAFPPTTGAPRSASVPAAGDVSDARVWPLTGLTGSTTGRLYLFTAGQSMQTYHGLCSGAVITSKTRNIVVTAAHCMYQPQRTGPRVPVVFAEFVPGDQRERSVTPYGVWRSSHFTIDPQFARHTVSVRRGDKEYTRGAGADDDFAFLAMDPQNGRNIQDVTGGQGVAFDTGWTSVWQLGYPSAPPFDGTSERMCASSPSSSTSDEHNLVWLACTMTPGSSGGAYLTDFDPRAGAGYVFAVQSLGSDDGTQNAGQLLNNAALTDYRRAQGLS
jgi:V8-like Glu-specific endopeptidase